jgi:hypothetical protein
MKQQTQHLIYLIHPRVRPILRIEECTSLFTSIQLQPGTLLKPLFFIALCTIALSLHISRPVLWPACRAGCIFFGALGRSRQKSPLKLIYNMHNYIVIRWLFIDLKICICIILIILSQIRYLPLIIVVDINTTFAEK